MHIHHSVRDEEQGWRGHWFVRNILSELPIIGGFFHTSKVSHGLHYAGKSAAMLVGGTAGMIIANVIPTGETHESMAVSMTKMTASMAVGMSVGTMAYNTFVSVGSKVYHDCCYRRAENQNTFRALLEDSSDQLAVPVNGQKVDCH